MPKVTAAELALQRKQPHEVGMRLSIYQPQIALACQLNNPSIAKGARSIDYDNATAGSRFKVAAGMTMLVGTAPGKSDIGRIRVRSITAGNIVVAENSDIAWADNLYLTILRFFDVVPVYPRIINDPADKEKVIFYKDYDIAYTNQNTKMGTLICMGSHNEAEIVPGVGATVYYSATGTTNVNDSGITYSWFFEGGVVTGSSALTPGNITYNTPGHYLTSLTTTSTQGAVDVSYRYIVINEPGGGIKDWQLLNGPQGNRDSGGYTANIRINSPLDFELYDGAVVILSTEEYYGGTKQIIGGSPFFVGYILQNSITYDYEKSSVDFQIGTVSELMKMSTGFAISVEDTANPSTWYQIENLNFRKAMYHYWKWHSTVLLTTDVQFIGMGDFLQQFFDSNKENIFDAVATVLRSARMGKLVCNRTSKIFAEQSMEAVSNAPSKYLPDYIMTKEDWLDEPNITENVHPQNSYLELGGIVYQGGATKESKALLSIAPGITPGVRGKYNQLSGLVLQSQAQLNVMSGNVWANGNTRYPDIGININGTRKNFDLAPMTSVSFQIQPEDTSRNVYISGSYYPTEISWSYDHEDRYLSASAKFSAITEGVPGETLILPTGTVDGDIPPGWHNPKYKLPKYPSDWYPEIDFPGANPPSGTVIPPSLGTLFLLLGGNVWYTQDFHAPTPTWSSAMGGISAGIITDFDVSRTGAMVLARGAMSDGSNANTTWGEIYTGAFGGTKTMVAGKDFFRTNFPYNPGSPYYFWMGTHISAVAMNFFGSEYAFSVNGDPIVGYGGFGIGNTGEPKMEYPFGSLVGADIGAISYDYYQASWLAAGGFGQVQSAPRLYVIQGDGKLATYAINFGGVAQNLGRIQRAGGVGDKCLLSYDNSNYIVTKAGTTQESSANNFSHADLDGLGKTVMTGGAVKVSYDGGYYFTSVASGMNLNSGWSCNMLYSNVWAFSANIPEGHLYYSEDYGATIVDKTTSLITAMGVASLPAISKMRFV